METVQTLLNILSGILGVFALLMLAFQLRLVVSGLSGKGKDYRDHDPSSRFLVLVHAHDQEKEIAGIVENLRHMEYPGELYDFYIVADNCADRTADVARQMGAGVIEISRAVPEAPTGKGIALRKALEILGSYQDNYDLLMVFDGNDLMDPNMFLEVNSQYLARKRPEVIQCYPGTRSGPRLMTCFHHGVSTFANRFHQLARYRMGLNCAVGSTGFAIDTGYLYRRGGWVFDSVTEGFELQLETVLQGGRVMWNHHVRVYQQNSGTIGGSFKQYTCRARGHFFICFKSMGRVLNALSRRRIRLKEGASAMVSLFSPFLYLTLGLQILIGLVSGGMGMPMALAGGLAGFMLLYYKAEWLDNKRPFEVKNAAKMLLSLVVGVCLAAVSHVKGLIHWRRQHAWAKTEHGTRHLEGYISRLTEGEKPSLKD